MSAPQRISVVPSYAPQNDSSLERSVPSECMNPPTKTKVLLSHPIESISKYARNLIGPILPGELRTKRALILTANLNRKEAFCLPDAFVRLESSYNCSYKRISDVTSLCKAIDDESSKNGPPHLLVIQAAHGQQDQMQLDENAFFRVGDPLPSSSCLHNLHPEATIVLDSGSTGKGEEWVEDNLANYVASHSPAQAKIVAPTDDVRSIEILKTDPLDLRFYHSLNPYQNEDTQLEEGTYRIDKSATDPLDKLVTDLFKKLLLTEPAKTPSMPSAPKHWSADGSIELFTKILKWNPVDDIFKYAKNLIDPFLPEKERTKRALILTANTDWNGGLSLHAFNDNIYTHRVIDRTYNVTYKRISDTLSLCKAIDDEASQNGPPHLLIIRAHGTQETMQLDEHSRLRIGDPLPTGSCLHNVHPEGTIILFSCSTGQGKDLEENIANYIADHAPAQAKILASTGILRHYVINKDNPADSHLYGFEDRLFVMPSMVENRTYKIDKSKTKSSIKVPSTDHPGASSIDNIPLKGSEKGASIPPSKSQQKPTASIQHTQKARVFPLPFDSLRNELRERVQEDMLFVNLMSLPMRAVGKGIETLCHSGKTAEKVCVAVGKGIDKVKNLVPSGVKNLYHKTHNQLIGGFERECGISAEETEYFLQSLNLTAGAGALNTAIRLARTVPINKVHSLHKKDLSTAEKRSLSEAILNNIAEETVDSYRRIGLIGGHPKMNTFRHTLPESANPKPFPSSSKDYVLKCVLEPDDPQIHSAIKVTTRRGNVLTLLSHDRKSVVFLDHLGKQVDVPDLMQAIAAIRQYVTTRLGSQSLELEVPDNAKILHFLAKKYPYNITRTHQNYFRVKPAEATAYLEARTITRPPSTTIPKNADLTPKMRENTFSNATITPLQLREPYNPKDALKERTRGYSSVHLEYVHKPNRLDPFPRNQWEHFYFDGIRNDMLKDSVKPIIDKIRNYAKVHGYKNLVVEANLQEHFPEIFGKFYWQMKKRHLNMRLLPSAFRLQVPLYKPTPYVSRFTLSPGTADTMPFSPKPHIVKSEKILMQTRLAHTDGRISLMSDGITRVYLDYMDSSAKSSFFLKTMDEFQKIAWKNNPQAKYFIVEWEGVNKKLVDITAKRYRGYLGPALKSHDGFECNDTIHRFRIPLKKPQASPAHKINKAIDSLLPKRSMPIAASVAASGVLLGIPGHSRSPTESSETNPARKTINEKEVTRLLQQQHAKVMQEVEIYRNAYRQLQVKQQTPDHAKSSVCNEEEYRRVRSMLSDGFEGLAANLRLGGKPGRSQDVLQFGSGAVVLMDSCYMLATGSSLLGSQMGLFAMASPIAPYVGLIQAAALLLPLFKKKKKKDDGREALRQAIVQAFQQLAHQVAEVHKDMFTAFSHLENQIEKVQLEILRRFLKLEQELHEGLKTPLVQAVQHVQQELSSLPVVSAKMEALTTTTLVQPLIAPFRDSTPLPIVPVEPVPDNLLTQAVSGVIAEGKQNIVQVREQGAQLSQQKAQIADGMDRVVSTQQAILGEMDQISRLLQQLLLS